MELNREIVLGHLAQASLYGNLGLFVGSGLSKALTENTRYKAPNFKELLDNVRQELAIDDVCFDNTDYIRGKSFPKIAQEIIEFHAEKKDITFTEALKEVKSLISKKCDFTPDKILSDKFRDHFNIIKPYWAITTNYDFILEDLIENSISLLPTQVLNVRNDFTPIYHLHGHRRDPNSIIITESDYVSILESSEYRQNRLSILLAESTTLMLGYSLGDLNVITAMNWVNKVKNEEIKKLEFEEYQGKIIQIAFCKKPKSEPYIGKYGEIIIETSDVNDFLEEVCKVIIKEKDTFEYNEQFIKKCLSQEHDAHFFTKDKSMRNNLIQIIQNIPRCYTVGQLILFFKSALMPIWKQAREDDQFSYYNDFMSVLLDILINLPFDSIHPSLMRYLTEQLDLIAPFIDIKSKSRGSAFEASETWKKRRSEIPLETRRDILNNAELYYKAQLLQLFDELG